jgi:hypothetical protein
MNHSGDVWEATVSLPPSGSAACWWCAFGDFVCHGGGFVALVDYFEYKYVVASPSGAAAWEIGTNREVTIQSREEEALLVDEFHARVPARPVRHVVRSKPSVPSEQRRRGRHGEIGAPEFTDVS